MLDTNVFDDVLSGKVPLSSFDGNCVLVIGVQHDELHRTPDPERRSALLKTFEAVKPEITLAASFAFDIEGAGLDQACWNDGSAVRAGIGRRTRRGDPPCLRHSRR